MMVMKKKKLTKGRLFWRCGKDLRSILLSVPAIALAGGVLCGLLYHLGLRKILALSLYLAAVWYLVFLVLFLLGRWKGFLLLRRQERLFGFRFADEDLEPDLPDERWFLSTDSQLIAFRRGFIRKTGKIRRLYEGRDICTMAVLDCEGKKHRIRGFEPDLLALKQWVAVGKPQ